MQQRNCSNIEFKVDIDQNKYFFIIYYTNKRNGLFWKKNNIQKQTIVVGKTKHNRFYNKIK